MFKKNNGGDHDNRQCQRNAAVAEFFCMEHLHSDTSYQPQRRFS